MGSLFSCANKNGALDQEFKEIVDVRAEQWAKKFKRMQINDVKNETVLHEEGADDQREK